MIQEHCFLFQGLPESYQQVCRNHEPEVSRTHKLWVPGEWEMLEVLRANLAPWGWPHHHPPTSTQKPCRCLRRGAEGNGRGEEKFWCPAWDTYANVTSYNRGSHLLTVQQCHLWKNVTFSYCFVHWRLEAASHRHWSLVYSKACKYISVNSNSSQSHCGVHAQPRLRASETFTGW